MVVRKRFRCISCDRRKRDFFILSVPYLPFPEFVCFLTGRFDITYNGIIRKTLNSIKVLLSYA